MLSKSLQNAMRIRKYTFIENLMSFIIGCLIVLAMLWVMLWQELNTVKPIKKLILPEYEYVKIEEPIKEEAEIKLKVEVLSEPIISEEAPIKYKTILNAFDGIANGPSGKETYYNLPMDKVVQIMRDKGYTEEDYPYIVRGDGVKCLGDYVIVAASFERYHRGQIIETSLGQGIVCDTGEFAIDNPEMIDIATNW